MNSARISCEIEELLRQEGPLFAEDIRSRLMVSSMARFSAAVYVLKEMGRAEPCSAGPDLMLRIPGDTRPLPEGLSSFGRKLGRERASRLATVG